MTSEVKPSEARPDLRKLAESIPSRAGIQDHQTRSIFDALCTIVFQLVKDAKVDTTRPSSSPALVPASEASSRGDLLDVYISGGSYLTNPYLLPGPVEAVDPAWVGSPLNSSRGGGFIKTGTVWSNNDSITVNSEQGEEGTRYILDPAVHNFSSMEFIVVNPNTNIVVGSKHAYLFSGTHVTIPFTTPGDLDETCNNLKPIWNGCGYP